MTLAIARRGDTLRFRGNTLPAIRSAISEGADVVAVDIRLTADGHVILLHDEALERLGPLPRPLPEATLADLAALGGEVEQRVPTLMEVLAEVSGSRPAALMLEATSTEAALAAAAQVREHGHAERVIHTGPVEALRALRGHHPEAALALTWDQPALPPTELWQALRPRFYHCRHTLLTREVITEVRRHGYSVSAWTVNDFSEMARLMGMGVDAILTDNTGELAKLTGEHR